MQAICDPLRRPDAVAETIDINSTEHQDWTGQRHKYLLPVGISLSSSASMAFTQCALRFRSTSRPALSKISFLPRFAAYSTRLSFASPPQSFGSSSRFTKLSHAISRPTINFDSIRFASGASLSKDDIQRRILEVLGSFEKCDPAKVGNHLLTEHVSATYTSCRHSQQITPTASFTSDLGLDSLDAVEVVMAIEEVKSDQVSISSCFVSPN
jgi:NADH dehydrogenase (ubiquinone) 1 alpha/beta subcomplex 1